MAFTLDNILDPFRHTPGVNRSLIYDSYYQKYLQVKDKIKWGTCRNGDNYIVHIRVPSTDKYCKDVYYDIVFEFFPESDKVLETRSLREYSAILYSNSPSFTFTFTYAYNKYELLIPWLIDKCIPRCLKDPAVMRNRTSFVGVDLKTWIAAQHIYQLGLLNYKAKFDSTINTNINVIKKHVLSQGALIIHRQRESDKTKAQVKHDKSASKAKARFKDYRKEQDFKHALHNKYGDKINSSSTAKKIAKTARAAKSSRSVRKHR